jgi:hypothetical protein
MSTKLVLRMYAHALHATSDARDDDDKPSEVPLGGRLARWFWNQTRTLRSVTPSARAASLRTCRDGHRPDANRRSRNASCAPDHCSRRRRVRASTSSTSTVGSLSGSMNEDGGGIRALRNSSERGRGEHNAPPTLRFFCGPSVFRALRRASGRRRKRTPEHRPNARQRTRKKIVGYIPWSKC